MIYPPSQAVEAQIKRVFTFDPVLGEDQIERISVLYDHARRFARAIAVNTPPSREQALALTKLEESLVHAILGISREEPRT